MTNLSINLNKIALLRNSRGIDVPNLVNYVNMSIDAGVDGITVHPREDSRHILLEDLIAIGNLEAIRSNKVEFNIEGDPRDQLLDFIEKEVHFHQFTIVPVTQGEVTSCRGWRNSDNLDHLKSSIQRIRLKNNSLRRISLFADPTQESITFCHQAGAEAVEFYTGEYALNQQKKQTLQQLEKQANLARNLGFRIHAGHDLNLENLPDLLHAIQPDELSIGHAIICDALVYGFKATIKKYIQCIKNYHL